MVSLVMSKSCLITGGRNPEPLLFLPCLLCCTFLLCSVAPTEQSKYAFLNQSKNNIITILGIRGLTAGVAGVLTLVILELTLVFT